MCIMCELDDLGTGRRRRRFLRLAMKTCKRFARALKTTESGWSVSMSVDDNEESADVWCVAPSGNTYQFRFGWVTEVWAHRHVPDAGEVREIARDMRRRQKRFVKQAERQRTEVGVTH